MKALNEEPCHNLSFLVCVNVSVCLFASFFYPPIHTSFHQFIHQHMWKSFCWHLFIMRHMSFVVHGTCSTSSENTGHRDGHKSEINCTPFAWREPAPGRRTRKNPWVDCRSDRSAKDTLGAKRWTSERIWRRSLTSPVRNLALVAWNSWGIMVLLGHQRRSVILDMFYQGGMADDYCCIGLWHFDWGWTPDEM